jgi:hypothetical protein
MKPIICCQCAQASFQAAFGLCHNCYSRQDRAARPEVHLARKRAYMAKNADRLREADRLFKATPKQREKRRNYLAANAEKVLAYHRDYNARRFDHIKERATKWRKKNLARCSAKQAARRRRESRFHQHLPEEHRNSILAFYAACPAGHHVDHIVPLAGKNVSGLHVIWNLQYLLALENRRKSNKCPS